MKKRCRIICLVSMLLLLASSLTVLAEDRKGASGWQVSFTGKKMESNFTTANIGDEVNAMQPGDSVEFTINLKNAFQGQADWYMENEVLETLEDAGDAAGGAYDYLLTYTDVNGETTTLYSSEKFGGEGRIGGVGLHGATTSLDEYFYLDRMGSNATGVVKLKVALDGETLVNNYQNTAALLQMDFAAQLISTEDETSTNRDPDKDPGSGTNTSTATNTGSSQGQRQRPVKTGDESRILFYVAVMFVSGLGLLAGGLLMLGHSREEETEEPGERGRS